MVDTDCESSISLSQEHSPVLVYHLIPGTQLILTGGIHQSQLFSRILLVSKTAEMELLLWICLLYTSDAADE